MNHNLEIKASQDLDELCQLMVMSLNALRKTNEMPVYMSSKAREINALQIGKKLEEKLENKDLLRQFKLIDGTRKICTNEDRRTKDSIIALARETRPFVDRIRSSNFKLMLDRLVQAHELAVKFSGLLDEIGVVEEQR
jgi:hypothetical protein